MMYCGVLNINKPAGMTSRDVVNRVIKFVRPAKAGHAGTLDPMATGVLVVCVGHATRLISFVQEGQKRYRGRFRLGQTSDTDDITGNLVEGGAWSGITRDALKELLSDFTGRIDQVPPQFSAVHVQGQRAYDLARRGEAVQLNARPVEIHSLTLTEFTPPDFELELECGSGTYVRSIGRDLGERLGCGAVMTQLERLAVSPFELCCAVELDVLTAASVAQYVQPMETIVRHLPQRILSNDETIGIRQGKSIEVGPIHSDHRQADKVIDAGDLRVALTALDGSLLGVGELNQPQRRIQPRIVFPM